MKFSLVYPFFHVMIRKKFGTNIRILSEVIIFW